MKRIAILAVMLLLIASISATGSAKDYSSEISSIMSSYTLNNYSCKSAVQQEVNGVYRSVEMLEIIAKLADSTGAHSGEIASVMSSYTLNNYSCKSAVQQAVNGSYRMVEMLEIIARSLNA